MWQGGFPESVSEALGAEQYTDAAAGALGGKYYISMKNSAGEWGLYVYDSLLGIWLREDSLHAVSFAAVDGELFCLDSDGRLIALTGSIGTPETGVNWSAESGIMYFLQPEHKYLHRLSLRLTMGAGSSVKAEIEYDSSGEWETAGREAAAQKSAETARRGNYDRLYKLIYNSGYNPNETELSDSGMTGEQAAALLAEYRRRNKIGTSNTYTYRGGTGSSKSKTKKKQRYTAPKSTRLASPGRNLDAVK